ncbi:MAG: hypothetical protein WA116_04550 [Anaerolineaceae bacterium]
MENFKKPFQVALFTSLIVLNVLILLSLTSTPEATSSAKELPLPQATLSQGHKNFLPIIRKIGSLVYVQSSTSYLEGSESEILHIVGEVFNNTGKTIHNVTIMASLFGTGSSTEIATLQGQPLAGVIPPGQSACFNLHIAKPTNYNSYSLGLPTYQQYTGMLPNLALANVSGGFDEDNDWYYLSGMVRNPSGTLLDNARVVGTLYNRTNFVVGCDQTYASFPEENPFADGSFDLYYLDRLYSDVASYKLQVVGTAP